MDKSENLKFDLFYLKEDGKSNTKESFKFILKKAEAAIAQYELPKIVDVGCAAGDLLAYIRFLYPNSILTGLDIQLELLTKAKEDLPSVDFRTFDLQKGDPTLTNSFDIAFLCGVHAAFDYPQDWLFTFLNLLKDKGTGFVYGNFNPEPIDVLVKVRPSGSEASFMNNWNMISQKTISMLLDGLGYEHHFHHFQIPIDIAKKPHTPLRSWTFKYEDGTRGTINGAQLLHQDYLLIIKKK